MSNIIGISAKIGCGKTLTAETLKSMGVVENLVAFGDAVKKESAQIFRFDVRHCYDNKDKVIRNPNLPGGEMTVRQILQWWGTDVRRGQDPLYWIKKTEGEINRLMKHGSVAVHDVRFKEEAGLIRDMGGLVVRLQPYPGWEPGPYADHQSETDLDDWQWFDLVLHPQFGQIREAAELIRIFVENTNPLEAGINV